ncbi:MAG: alpha/beta fold hydrolase, partial [Candidatus Levybacteria bacterium]|nr:alpha/beta fold hydrolase [Candidatus Levybacteria bacterium]
MRIGVLITFVVLFAFALFLYLQSNKKANIPQQINKVVANLHPLSIESMRQKKYPGSEIIIEQELPQESNYRQYIGSYMSEGLKIYGLLTIPTTQRPENGYPAIIFNHGYIPPSEYRTNERYIAYVDTFARSGYVVFKSDYRGHGSSEGEAVGAYFSPGYTTDVLNALESVKKLEYVNPDKLGMWGHSMGGTITQRALVISPDIKAAVIWGGVVGSYEDIYT